MKEFLSLGVCMPVQSPSRSWDRCGVCPSDPNWGENIMGFSEFPELIILMKSFCYLTVSFYSTNYSSSNVFLFRISSINIKTALSSSSRCLFSSQLKVCCGGRLPVTSNLGVVVCCCPLNACISELSSEFVLPGFVMSLNDWRDDEVSDILSNDSLNSI